MVLPERALSISYMVRRVKLSVRSQESTLQLRSISNSDRADDEHGEWNQPGCIFCQISTNDEACDRIARQVKNEAFVLVGRIASRTARATPVLVGSLLSTGCTVTTATNPSVETPFPPRADRKLLPRRGRKHRVGDDRSRRIANPPSRTTSSGAFDGPVTLPTPDVEDSSSTSPRLIRIDSASKTLPHGRSGPHSHAIWMGKPPPNFSMKPSSL